MKKALYSLLAAISMLAAGDTMAQCPAGRYNTELFSTYSVSTVTYSAPYNLQMDIYQPDGDTYASRPVMILGHGGSFIGGSKTDDGTIVELCKRFAKRGFVTASINYRLGDLLSLGDSAKATAIVVKAINDGKAAMRFFSKDAATTNTYRVDTNNIFVGGNSAGAVLYMHVGYMSSMSEVPPYIADTIMAHGGFEGNSGNPGHVVNPRGIINLAGALNMTSFVQHHDKPSVNAQGTDDATVPYNCAYPLSGYVHVNLCGLGQLESAYAAQGVYHFSKIYPGEGHVPWSSNTAMFTSVDSMVKLFAYNLMCTDISGVKEAGSAAEVSLYPNPASSTVTISAPLSIAAITINDHTGRLVYSASDIKSESYSVNTARLAPGIYFVRASFADDNMTPVVKRLVIE